MGSQRAAGYAEVIGEMRDLVYKHAARSQRADGLEYIIIRGTLNHRTNQMPSSRFNYAERAGGTAGSGSRIRR